ncbi:hypothetical protein GCM10009534_73520 [Kribbella sandramycini]
MADQAAVLEPAEFAGDLAGGERDAAEDVRVVVLEHRLRMTEAAEACGELSTGRPAQPAEAGCVPGGVS